LELLELLKLRELNIWSVTLRLSLAMLLGGMIGLERGRKRRAAGFRTYMLVCLGSALTMLLGQYCGEMVSALRLLPEGGTVANADVSRMGAQVINGIGFLGAGTIIVTGQQRIRGLTTAAGLWASACMGLAVGAGFYECVLPAALLIFVSIRVLPRVGTFVAGKTRNMILYVEFESIDDIGTIINRIKSRGVHIRDVELDHDRNRGNRHPNMTFSLRLNKKQTHAQLLAAMSDLSCIHVIEEL